MRKHVKSLQQLIEIAKSGHYFDINIIENVVNDMKLLPLGTILHDNIKSEWKVADTSTNIYYDSNVNETKVIGNTQQSHYNLFVSYLKSQELQSKFISIKQNFQKETPFGLAEFLCINDFSMDSSSVPNDTLKMSLKHANFLRCLYFFNESNSTEMFYKTQRQRKIWWMKFSSNPGRFFVSDPKTEQIGDGKMHSVTIKAKYDFGNLELENIEMIPLKILPKEITSEFYLRDTKLEKRVMPCAIKTEICLEVATLGLIFDAIESSESKSLMIHRKIAPYQLSVFCISENANNLIELQDLALLVTASSRKAGISCLNLHKSYVHNKTQLDKELGHMDKMGVPFCLILNDETLKNGLLQLRNRDTTISEIIHLSDIPKYLLKIFLT